LEWGTEVAGLRAFREVSIVLTEPFSDTPELSQKYKHLLRELLAEPAGVDVTQARCRPAAAAVISFNVELELFQFHSIGHMGRQRFGLMSTSPRRSPRCSLLVTFCISMAAHVTGGLSTRMLKGLNNLATCKCSLHIRLYMCRLIVSLQTP